MQIPEGMTENEVIEVIKEVAHSLAPKYKFGYFTEEDIEQEAFMMGMDGLNYYDETRSLKTFLFVHISNKLKTFKRDNYCRPRQKFLSTENLIKRWENTDGAKLRITHMMSLHDVEENRDSNLYSISNLLDKLSVDEIFSKIDRELPNHMRNDYLRILNEVNIPKGRRDKVLNKIREILDEKR